MNITVKKPNIYMSNQSQSKHFLPPKSHLENFRNMLRYICTSHNTLGLHTNVATQILSFIKTLFKVCF